MIVVDTSGLVAAYDAAQRTHPQVLRVPDRETGPLLLSPFILAELDYLLATKLGSDAEEAALRDISTGVFQLVHFDQKDVQTALSLIQQYRGLHIGLADASLAVIAARFKTTRLLTLDHRHFRAVTPLWGNHFQLLPADEE